MFEMFPPVTRPRILLVAKPSASKLPFESNDPLFKKFAMLLLGTLKSPKLWNRFSPPPGLVPPVMLNWVWPFGRLMGADTAVFRPDDVIGVTAGARETEHGMARRRETPNMQRRIRVVYSPCGLCIENSLSDSPDPVGRTCLRMMGLHSGFARSRDPFSRRVNYTKVNATISPTSPRFTKGSPSL